MLMEAANFDEMIEANSEPSLGPSAPPADAVRVVTMLYGDAAAHCHFQTVPEDTARTGSKALARVVEGALAECWPELQRLNLEGYGIHLAINQIRPCDARIASNVQRLLAVWSDLDQPISPTKLHEVIGALPLPPSLVTETSLCKHHLLWKLDGSCTLANWNAIMRGIHTVLEPHGADPAVIDVVRALRLSGILHQKHGRPFRCRILDELTTGETCTAEELREAYPAPIAEPKPRRRQDGGERRHTKGETIRSTEDHDNLVGALKALEDKQTSGGPFTVHSGDPKDKPLVIDMRDRPWWLRTGMAIHHGYNGSDQGQQLWDAISGGGNVQRSDGATVTFKGQPDKFDPADQNRNWHSFKDPTSCIAADPITIRTIIWAASKACNWRPPGTRGRKPGSPQRPQVSATIAPVRHAAAECLGVGITRYGDVWLQIVEQLYARHPLKRRLCHLLWNRINPATGLGAYSGPMELSAHERIETSAKSVENAIRDIVRDGLIIKSHGRHYAGPGLGVGVLYAHTVPPSHSHLLNDIQINRPYPIWEGGINRPYPTYMGLFPLPTDNTINQQLVSDTPPPTLALHPLLEPDQSETSFPSTHPLPSASPWQSRSSQQPQHVPVHDYDEFVRLLVGGRYLSSDIGQKLRQATESWPDAVGERVRFLAAWVRLLRLDVRPDQTNRQVNGYVSATCRRQQKPLEHVDPRTLVRGHTTNLEGFAASGTFSDRAETYHPGQIRIDGEAMPLPMRDGIAPPLPKPEPKPKRKRKPTSKPRRPNRGTPERVVVDALSNGRLGWAVLLERVAVHPSFVEQQTRGDGFNALRRAVEKLEARGLVTSDDAEVWLRENEPPVNASAPIKSNDEERS